MSGAPVIGIDLSATNLQFGVVDGAGSILGRAAGKTGAADGHDAVIRNVVRGIRSACDDAGIALRDVAAVGVAAAGAIDMPRGVVLESPNIGWRDYPLRDVLSEHLTCPVLLDNDVNGAVWGEYCLGAGRGRGDVLGVWVGTGIGGGLVLNGRLYRGDSFTAGEIGNTVIDPDGAPGARTVEEHCGRVGLRRILSEPVETAHIKARYEQGEERMVEVVNRSAELLGLAIANWVTVLSLDAVLLGGGLVESLGEPYVARLRASFDRNVFPDRLQACPFLITELAADSGLLGAALLARDAVRA